MATASRRIPIVNIFDNMQLKPLWLDLRIDFPRENSLSARLSNYSNLGPSNIYRGRFKASSCGMRDSEGTNQRPDKLLWSQAGFFFLGLPRVQILGHPLNPVLLYYGTFTFFVGFRSFSFLSPTPKFSLNFSRFLVLVECEGEFTLIYCIREDSVCPPKKP